MTQTLLTSENKENINFREVLKSIRQNHDQLHETEGGCALWVKRAWVRSLLHTK